MEFDDTSGWEGLRQHLNMIARVLVFELRIMQGQLGLAVDVAASPTRAVSSAVGSIHGAG